MRRNIQRNLAIVFCLFISTSVWADDSDVVVYSGTPSGIAASVAAAREGAKVVLIEPTQHVGGLATSGLNTAETEHMLAWTIGGIADEFFQNMGKIYGMKRPAYNFESSIAEKAFLSMLDKAEVKVIYGASIMSVKKEEGKIKSLLLSDGKSIGGKVFIDASYEGDLMARAKVDYRVGRESAKEFNESLAGIRFDKAKYRAKTTDASGKLHPGIMGWAKDFKEGEAHPETMNFNFRLTIARNPALQVPIPKPDNYDASRFVLLKNWIQDELIKGNKISVRNIMDFYPRRNGKFEVNNKQAAVISIGHFGGQFGWADGTYEERKKIYQDHLDYTLGMFHFLATDASVPESLREEVKAIGLHKDEFKDNRHLPYQLYVREGRRMKGAYVVNQHDVQVDRRKKDSIGMGSHFMDCHHVQRLAIDEDTFMNEGRIWQMGYAYQIPYRSITPKVSQCSNLLVPCAASFTHVAYCTLRVEATWMVTGESAGIAAVMAAKEGIAIQEVDIEALQKTLRKNGQVIDFIEGKPEKCMHLNGPKEF